MVMCDNHITFNWLVVSCVVLRKIFLPVILLLLAYGFWVSPNFKEIAMGVALFLFGMMCLEEGFKAFTGGVLETILRKSTSRQWKSLVFGMTSTALLQSSTLVSLITISFVSAEMISLAAGIGIVLGANIGTTSGAWLIAGLGLKVNIASYAMPALIFGVVFTLQKSKTLKGLGYILLGIGFLFLGIHYMKSGFEAFQSTVDLITYTISGLTGVLFFTLIGVIITVIMQSSHATLLVIIAALATGQVSYENALALAIGANLGSAVTTAMAGMAANLGGKRLAIVHVLFNFVIACLGIALISQLMWIVDVSANLLGIAKDSYLLKLALFHTIYNVIGVILFWPFVKPLERLLVKYVTFVPKSSEKPLYLYAQAIETPATAVSAVRKEVRHLFDNAYGLLVHGISLRRAVIDSEESLADAVKYTRRIISLDVDDIYEAKIKSLYSEIVGFIGEAQTRELTPEATEELYALRQAGRDIVEAVKAMKHMHKNISKYGASFNMPVREQYDIIRLQVATLLRELRIILDTPKEELVDTLSLERVEQSIGVSNQQLMDSLDEMIRAKRINPAIATSIMNDEVYVTDLAKNLLEAVRILLVEKTQQSDANLVANSEQEASS